jgi:hypothetical protein
LINRRSLLVSFIHLLPPIKRTYEQDLTGKNRERGTLIPMALSKCYLSADTEGMMVKTYLDSGTDGGLELNNGLSLVGDLTSALHNIIPSSG